MVVSLDLLRALVERARLFTFLFESERHDCWEDVRRASDCDLSESGEYCASLSGGVAGDVEPASSSVPRGRVDGACPRTCASRNLTDGVGAASEGEFFDDYGYWAKVRAGETSRAGAPRVRKKRRRRRGTRRGRLCRARALFEVERAIDGAPWTC